ncbi:MAG: tetratricopeptide repeat protein [Anaerolineae bacterium]
MSQEWKPSNEPGRYYDEARVAQLEPIQAAIEELGLSLIRFRKLRSILNALEVQIEDGGDSPEVNQMLLDALRASLRHQVGESAAQAALRAIDVFEQAEVKRWEQVKAGTLPPIELTPEQQLDDLMQEGYELLQTRQEAPACDRWLEGWELIKQMATPEMRTVDDFDAAYPGMLQSVFNWCSDLDMELHNAGLDNPIYHEHRLRYAREFLAQFPDEDADRHVSFMRAQGEALWNLGRRTEAEKVYAELVERFPNKGWGYIGWSDNYWLWGSPDPKEYDKAEAILQRALARPNLQDRSDVLDRLADLYAKWGKPEKQAARETELEQSRSWRRFLPKRFAPTPPSTKAPPPTRKRKRRKRKKRRR